MQRKLAENLDPATVSGFGAEWTAYDQAKLSREELRALFDRYFRLFPWSQLPADAVGFDMGCGSGRWATLVAPRVGTLHCIDASAEALDVARRNLSGVSNCRFHLSSVDRLPLANGSMDFGYSLGVLHHIPDPHAGLSACVEKLKAGAPFLLYLYYALDNRPTWFKALWKGTDILRHGISRLPFRARLAASNMIAAAVYFPVARLAELLERRGMDVGSIPLSAYRHRSFYTMRTDALDRFGTRREARFTAAEVRTLMQSARLERIAISSEEPYWCAVGYRAR